MYTFMNQNYIEVERGVEHRNYQKEVAIFTDFWQKTVKRSKNEENRIKKPKINSNQGLYVQFSQKLLFTVKKSFTKRSTWSKNFSRLAKILGQNAAWTNLLPEKKIAGQVLTYNSKNFHFIDWTEKLDLEWTMSELRKPFKKNQIK